MLPPYFISEFQSIRAVAHLPLSDYLVLKYKWVSGTVCEKRLINYPSGGKLLAQLTTYFFTPYFLNACIIMATIRTTTDIIIKRGIKPKKVPAVAYSPVKAAIL